MVSQLGQKKLLLWIILLNVVQLLFLTNINSQTSLYLENFTGVTPPNLPGGWSFNSQIETSSSAASTGYTGASGGNNLLAKNCQPLGENRWFMVEGVSTIGAAGLTIQFGHRRTNAFDVPITLEWSSDGSTWNTISGYNSSVATTSWSLAGPFTLPSSAENQSNLRFRWSYTTDDNSGCATAAPNYRIDDFQILATTLPIELTHFTANEKANKVELSWQTQSETNSDYFQVEHAVNGTDFRPLAKIEAAGFSTTLMNYQFIHDSPANGTNYYRLNQFDFDGSSHFSRIVSVIVNRSGKTVIYPTPATNVIYLRLPEENTDAAELIISDNVGRLLKRFFIEPGVNEHAIAIEDLNPGHYLLSAQYGRTFETLRFIKH